MARQGWFWDLVEGRAEWPPVAQTLGFKLLDVNPDEGTVEVTITASEQFLNSNGTVQGGFVAAMLDATLGPAIGATLADGEFAPTTDLHVQFLRPARQGRFTGRGRIVRKGRDVAFMAGDLLDEDGNLVATATATVQIRKM